MERCSPGTCCQTGWPEIIAETDAAIGLGLGKEDAPAIFGHADETVGGPAFGVHAGGRSEIDVAGVEIAGAEAVPPFQESGLPVFERALEGAIRAELDIVILFGMRS